MLLDPKSGEPTRVRRQKDKDGTIERIAVKSGSRFRGTGNDGGDDSRRRRSGEEAAQRRSRAGQAARRGKKDGQAPRWPTDPAPKAAERQPRLQTLLRADGAAAPGQAVRASRTRTRCRGS